MALEIRAQCSLQTYLSKCEVEQIQRPFYPNSRRLQESQSTGHESLQITKVWKLHYFDPRMPFLSWGENTVLGLINPSAASHSSPWTTLHLFNNVPNLSVSWNLTNVRFKPEINFVMGYVMWGLDLSSPHKKKALEVSQFKLHWTPICLE